MDNDWFIEILQKGQIVGLLKFYESGPRDLMPMVRVPLLNFKLLSTRHQYKKNMNAYSGFPIFKGSPGIRDDKQLE